MRKKWVVCMIACLTILLTGCNGNTAKETARNDTDKRISSTAGNTETEKADDTTSVVPETPKVTEEVKPTKPKPTEEPKQSFDVNPYVSYARSYAQSIGLELDSTATDCWDNPITANAKRTGIKDDIQSRLNRYKNVEGFTAVWVWVEKVSDTEYEIYIGYC